MNPLLTVFTPAYNRKNLLYRAYKSMKRQTDQDFIWLIVDDGSTDGTGMAVERWMQETHGFTLRYVRKENGGLQSGYVEALKHIDTELCFCVDSDDYLLDDGIERLREFWEEYGLADYAGILALDRLPDGSILGGKFPGVETGDAIDLLDIDIRKKIVRPKADRVLVIRTDIYRTAEPAKKYPGERMINATYLHLQIAKKWKFLLLNEPICVIEYQPDGMSNIFNKLREYSSAPHTYADWRIFRLGFGDLPFIDKCSQNIHYIAECRFAGRRAVHDSPTKLMTMVLYPAGLLWYCILKLWRKK